MISVTPIFFPSWVPVPQAVASMVSNLSRENPGTLPNISKPVKSRTLKTTLYRPDFVRMFISSSLPLGRDCYTIGKTSYVSDTETINHQNYLRHGKPS